MLPHLPTLPRRLRGVRSSELVRAVPSSLVARSLRQPLRATAGSFSARLALRCRTLLGTVRPPGADSGRVCGHVRPQEASCGHQGLCRATLIRQNGGSGADALLRPALLPASRGAHVRRPLPAPVRGPDAVVRGTAGQDSPHLAHLLGSTAQRGAAEARGQSGADVIHDGAAAAAGESIGCILTRAAVNEQFLVEYRNCLIAHWCAKLAPKIRVSPFISSLALERFFG